MQYFSACNRPTNLWVSYIYMIMHDRNELNILLLSGKCWNLKRRCWNGSIKSNILWNQLGPLIWLSRANISSRLLSLHQLFSSLVLIERSIVHVSFFLSFQFLLLLIESIVICMYESCYLGFSFTLYI